VSEPVNLNKVRKARARAAKETQAAENRVIHGRSKAQKAADRAAAAKLRKAVDTAKKEP
jgi:hypothetical protein